MKTLQECEKYYKKCYLKWIESIKENERDLETIRHIQDTLHFIYGSDFEIVEPRWAQETLNYYYSNKK